MWPLGKKKIKELTLLTLSICTSKRESRAGKVGAERINLLHIALQFNVILPFLNWL